MAHVVVLGAGGMGREAAAWVRAQSPDDELRGFLDANGDLHGHHVADLPVLGGESWLDGHPGVDVVVAIGDSQRRHRAGRRLIAAGHTVRTVVHPSAVVGPRTVIGAGALVCPQAFVSCDAHVGRLAIINFGARIGHDARIGDGAFVGPGAHLAGAVHVGVEAEIGIGASVIQGVHVGDRCVVGAGAAVVRDVAADTTVMGVPARPR